RPRVAARRRRAARRRVHHGRELAGAGRALHDAAGARPDLRGRPVPARVDGAELARRAAGLAGPADAAAAMSDAPPLPRAPRLAGKIAIVMGGGQTPGDTIGNGRATAVLFAREGATVLVVDRRGEAAEETVAQIRAEGGGAEAVEADATREDDCAALFARCVAAHGRIDVLHNNVGIGGGDAGPAHVDLEAWDRILHVNLKSVVV